MSTIKGLKPNKNSKYLQGDYDKYNPKKYFGIKPIIYRSSYELKFMRICELNQNVIKWSSEQISIPYFMLEKVKTPTGSIKVMKVRHTYYTDFSVITKDGKKYLIEVKPGNLVPLNESQIRRNPAIYKNVCKWKAAISWAKQNGYIFKIITEEHLKTKIF